MRPLEAITFSRDFVNACVKYVGQHRYANPPCLRVVVKLNLQRPITDYIAPKAANNWFCLVPAGLFNC